MVFLEQNVALKPNPAANRIETAIISRPEAIPPSLKAM